MRCRNNGACFARQFLESAFLVTTSHSTVRRRTLRKRPSSSETLSQFRTIVVCGKIGPTFFACFGLTLAHWLGLVTGDSMQAFLQDLRFALRQMRKANSVESASGMDEWNLTTTGGDVPEDLTAIYFTGNAFNHFGVPALLGRGLLPTDAPEGQDPQPVAVLGYQFWQRHYNGDPEIVGKTIQLTHKSYTVVGVAPPRFTWGDGDVYLPWKFTNDPTRGVMPQIRLKPGVSHAAANAEVQILLEQFAKETPKHFPEQFKTAIQGLNDQFIERLGGTLRLLFLAVALLLLIGCGNVSILLLARGTARQHEMAVRSAIGAVGSRILRQLLTESLLLSFTGTLLGVLLGYKLLALIVNWLPAFSFPHEAAIKMNVPVLLFSVALALLTGRSEERRVGKEGRVGREV